MQPMHFTGISNAFLIHTAKLHVSRRVMVRWTSFTPDEVHCDAAMLHWSNALNHWECSHQTHCVAVRFCRNIPHCAWVSLKHDGTDDTETSGLGADGTAYKERWDRYTAIGGTDRTDGQPIQTRQLCPICHKTGCPVYIGCPICPVMF